MDKATVDEECTAISISISIFEGHEAEEHSTKHLNLPLFGLLIALACYPWKTTRTLIQNV